MTKVLARGDSVYECDVCKRRIRVPAQRRGMDVVQRCIITHNCHGKMHRVRLTKEINSTPAFPTELAGVQDWAQRQILYTHNQTVQSFSWVINHKLSNNPNIYTHVARVVDGNEVMVPIEPDVINIIDLNTIEIKFNQAERGLAQCIAAASKNTINPVASAGIAATVDDSLLTNVGELTIATLDTMDNVNLEFTYDSPSSTLPVIIEYSGINRPSTSSAWRDAGNVIINGRRYRVRSFNILTNNPAPTYFGQGAIANGSYITITSDVKANQVLILMALPPFASADKVTSKYIDCATLTSTPYIYYNQGDLYAKDDVIKNTYPPIIVA